MKCLWLLFLTMPAMAEDCAKLCMHLDSKTVCVGDTIEAKGIVTEVKGIEPAGKAVRVDANVMGVKKPNDALIEMGVIGKVVKSAHPSCNKGK